MDIRLKGSPREGSEKFIDKGYRNAPTFFVEEVMPVLLAKIYARNNVDEVKKYWTDLARKGYENEEKKDTAAKKNKMNKTKGSKAKCDHCMKIVGKKLVLQCKSCLNVNMEECLTNIEEGRLRDFRMGNDEFVCNK